MTINIREAEPVTVSETTKQTGEISTRWSWVEPSVWTPRMLTALEQGVKGGKWFSLIDKVYAPANLAQAYTRVAANGGAGAPAVAGADGGSAASFAPAALACLLAGYSRRNHASSLTALSRSGAAPDLLYARSISAAACHSESSE